MTELRPIDLRHKIIAEHIANNSFNCINCLNMKQRGFMCPHNLNGRGGFDLYSRTYLYKLPAKFDKARTCEHANLEYVETVEERITIHERVK